MRKLVLTMRRRGGVSYIGRASEEVTGLLGNGEIGWVIVDKGEGMR